MGLWSWLTTSEKAVDTGLDLVKDVSSGIDVLFYTDEEKAQAKSSWWQMWMKQQEVIGDGNSIRSKTRRLLSILFTVNFLIIVDIAIYAACKGWAEVVQNIITTAAAFKLGAIQLTIVIFYFGYYGIQAVIGKWKKGK
jgi:hypothetical protein